MNLRVSELGRWSLRHFRTHHPHLTDGKAEVQGGSGEAKIALFLSLAVLERTRGRSNVGFTNKAGAPRNEASSALMTQQSLVGTMSREA